MKLNRCSHLFVIKNILIILMLGTINIAHAQAPVRKPERQTTTQQKPKNKPSNTVPKQSRKQVVSGTINGHDYADLGLSVKWATCNIGSSCPSDYGDYFAWGETSTKACYTQENCAWYREMIESLGSKGVIDYKENLTPRYDTARQQWGSSWRMPTSAEIVELIDKCSWKWTTQGGKNGYKVTGPNGNSIFLPAAGNRLNRDLNDAGSYGRYWSASAYDNYVNDWSLVFDSSRPYLGCSTRAYGHPIRPVTE